MVYLYTDKDQNNYVGIYFFRNIQYTDKAYSVCLIIYKITAISVHHFKY